jgi:zinc protease
MVGDVTQIEAHILAEKYFDGWSRDLVALQAPEVKDQSSRQVLIVDRPSSPQTQVLMGQLGVSRNHPDYVAIEVMNMLFGGMFSSRINHNLREVHGYTYGANSRFTYRRSLGPFLISGAIRTDATAAAVAEVFHEMDRLRETLAMPEELAIASESLTRLLISRFDTAASSSGSISELFTHDLDPHHFKKILEQISRVRSSDVQRVAKEHLLPESMIVVAVGDATKIESDLSNLNLGPLRCVREGR